jgi:hypothetical protein
VEDAREGKLTSEDLVEGAHGEGDGGFVIDEGPN